MEPVDELRFRAAMGSFATGVCVVATRDSAGQPVGFTASSIASVSLEPPLILFCIGRDASVSSVFEHSRAFAVSVLRAGQASISEDFARDPRAWFETGRWSAGPGGAPLLDDGLAALECTVERIDDGGDHVIVLGRVLRTIAAAGEPLIHFRGRYRGLSDA